MLKFFLQIAWELKVFDAKKYAQFFNPLTEIGNMLGGWIRNIEKETPPLPKK